LKMQINNPSGKFWPFSRLSWRDREHKMQEEKTVND
jgi:hypothetical protein